MTRDEAADRISSLLGFRTDVNDRAIQTLKEAQQDLEGGHIGILPWFLRKFTTINIAAEISAVPVPIDFLRIVDQKYSVSVRPTSHTNNETWVKVMLVPYVNTATPFIESQWKCWVDGDYIRLDRQINRALDVQIYYSAVDQTLDVNRENQWLKYSSSLMIGLAGRKLKGFRDKEADEEFRTMYIEGRDATVRSHYAATSGTTAFGGSEG